MSRYLAARDFLCLSPALSRLCTRLEEAHARPEDPPWVVKRAFFVLALWPVFVEAHAQAFARADFDRDFHEELNQVLIAEFGSGVRFDPLPHVLELAAEFTSYVCLMAPAVGAPLDILLDSLGRFGLVDGDRDWTRTTWHLVDPDQTLPGICHSVLKKHAKHLVANKDLPSDRRARVAVIAEALVGRVALRRMRDAA